MELRVTHVADRSFTRLLCSLSDNAVDVKGGKALARALERNKTLLELKYVYHYLNRWCSYCYGA